MLHCSKHHLIRQDLIVLIPCLIYTVDCEWSAWEYGKCSASCGTGTQEMRRSYRSIHGERCGVDDQVEARPCKYPDCPGIRTLIILVSFQNYWLVKIANDFQCWPFTVNCEWSPWAAFGICSKTCGKGLRTTYRTKIVHEKDGGKCLGETTKQQECNIMDCPGKYYIPNLTRSITIIAY